MNKYLLFMGIVLGLSSCTTKDVHYYRSNPQRLQEAMQACPQVQPSGLSCGDIKDLATHMSKLVYELQYNPQGFGHKILNLQQTIALQEQTLKTKNGTPELQNSLRQNKEELADSLAVVKWLESPEG